MAEAGGTPSGTRLVKSAVSGLWWVLLATIPVTSFPWISGMLAGETPVSPLSSLPLVGLAAIWLLPGALRGLRLSRLAVPLLVFAALAVVSALLSTGQMLLPFKGQLPPARMLRALATLAAGLGFYVCAATLPTDEEARRRSLRALYAGAAVLLVWSAVQAWVVLTDRPHVPLVVTQLHHIFSIRDPLEDRVTGFAYEPSWLGNQLAILYVPLLLASVAERRSVFSRSRSRWSVELVLLALCGLTLALTRSRISQLSVLLVAAVLLGVWVWAAIASRVGSAEIGGAPTRRLVRVAAASVAVTLAAGLLLGAAAWAISRSDARMRSLFQVRERIAEANFAYPNEGAYEIANRLVLAERLVYWTAAFRTFAAHPLMGVGPGNAGFFFAESLPAYAHQLTEIRQVLIDPSFGFPNPKNLWLRVLAEQGVLGFAVLASWLGLVALRSMALWQRGQGWHRVIGMAGAMALLAQVVEGFSLDTYGLPTPWIVVGLVTACGGPADDQPGRTL